MKTNHLFRKCLSKIFYLVFSIVTLSAGQAFPSDTLNPEIGVCTGVDNAAMLASSGYSYIEEGVGRFLMPLKSEEEFEVVLQKALNAPIPVRACNGFIPADLKSVGPEANHPAVLEYAETAFRRAQMAGIEYIVFGSSGSRSIPEGFPFDEARKQFISLGKQMAVIAARYNIVVVLEPLNSKEVNFINSVEEGAQIVREINHPSFLLLADIYHMLMENESPQSIIRNAHLIRHVHVAELQGRAAPGTHNEDLSAYYDALRQAGYKGRISIEGRWTNMQEQAEKAIQTIQQQL